jgi:hypothetical protein
LPDETLRDALAAVSAEIEEEESVVSTEAALSVRQRSPVDVDRLRLVLYPEPSRSPFILEDGVGDEELTAGGRTLSRSFSEWLSRPCCSRSAQRTQGSSGADQFSGRALRSGDPSPAHTALREAAEEIGLAAAHMDIRRLPARIPYRYRLSRDSRGGHGDAALRPASRHVRGGGGI